MLFSLLQVPWAINVENMKWCWKLILLSILSPNMRRFVQDFFWWSLGTSDRYVQQIDRAVTTFYNFCNFNILGIVQFKFNSSIFLFYILYQSTCLNRWVLIKYKNKWNILITSNLSCTSDRCTFWPIVEFQLSQ